MSLTAEKLKARLRYCPDSGEFYYRVRVPGGRPVGSVAGYISRANRARYICVNGRDYFAHRLAWFYVHGEWPNGQIDHINRNPSDNRITNLRIATPTQNSANCLSRANTSGFKGVCWHKTHRRWLAQIMVQGKHRALGLHKTPEAAHAAYAAAAREAWGEFARTE